MTNFGLTLTNRGVVTGDSSLEEMYDLARRVDDDERFTSVWVGDSITAKPRLDALSLMSALAARTERVRIGPGCFATTPVRPAILLAYQLAAIDVISNGRLTFAACMGAADASEFDHFCVPPVTRSGRMEEAIEIIRLLTSEDDASYHGKYNDFDNLTIEPHSIQRPIPILIVSNPNPNDARNRERGLRRVARLGDGWMSTTLTPELLGEYLGDIHRYADEAGRELPDDFDVVAFHSVMIDDDRDAAYAEAKRFLDDYYFLDHSEAMVRRWCSYGPPEQAIEDIQRYIDAGATSVLLRICSGDQITQYQRISEEVLPAFI
ncbi:MAG: LLM class flavin-dependent oxidoreductase [Chloroflexi bacterium]|nr:LLM class flavin-dependent oxidoreductase [Chloroflexota bacterium]MCY3686316.1 LLM class flavin-dependent oxidoreductase [Chloroflexota bacterium]MDE2708937.1 LLM class flavin-dependent oxidoreductase [Chloroflexota bacterium]